MDPYLERMASGNLSLVIAEDDVSWQSFPARAEQFLRWAGGTRQSLIDSPVERMWEVTIDGQPFWLTYEDFPNRLVLDSKQSSCNPVVQMLFDRLVHGQNG
jgi:hypothetical protein